MDLGANIGFTTLYFAMRFPYAQLASIEMMPDNARVIEWMIKRNRLTASVLQVAAGSTEGTAVVALNKSHTRHRLACLEADPHPEFGFVAERVKVSVKTLGSILDSLGWKSVDFLKVDIEGAEALLLEDLDRWASRVGDLIMEIHHNLSAPTTVARLAAAGFHVVGEEASDRYECWMRRKVFPENGN